MQHFCKECVNLLLDYVEDRLSPKDKADLDAHFARCPPCLEFMRSYRETPRILRDATAAEMPDVVRQKLWAFLAEKKQSG